MSRDFKYADGSQLQVQDPSSGGKHNVGVAYRNLSTTDYQKTFANYPGAILSQIRSFLTRRQSSRINILRDFGGLLKSGEMLVVLGRPGSGCSTLLKVLAGQTYGLHIDDHSEISYQGEPGLTL